VDNAICELLLADIASQECTCLCFQVIQVELDVSLCMTG